MIILTGCTVAMVTYYAMKIDLIFRQWLGIYGIVALFDKQW